MSETETTLKTLPKVIQVSLAILMGLPASGKTTLAHKIVSKLQVAESDTVGVLISYDDFVPLEVQAKCVLLSETNSAKLLRKKFIKCVSFIIEYLGKQNLSVQTPNSSSTEEPHNNLNNLFSSDENTENLVSNEIFISKVKDIVESISKKLRLFQSVKNVVLLIDDNHYYKSMRNEVYQIAKTHAIGFCIFYTKASVKICRERNSKRENKFQVPDKSIVEMSLKLEEPNPLENVYDSFCVVIENHQDSVEEDNIPLVIQVLKNSLIFPVNWEPPLDRTEDIEKERRICSQNEVHQADQILRKWINKELTLSSFCKKSSQPQQKREMSKDLIKKKNIVLDKLRSGEFKILADVTQDIEFRQEVVKLFAECVITLE